MEFFVENTGGREFKLVPAGTHLARFYRIVDLGTQRSSWNGQEKFLRKMMVRWEVHGEDKDGNALVTDENEPLSLFKNYTHSMAENSNLRKDIQSWLGYKFQNDVEARRFNIGSILGEWCMVNVVHDTGNDGKIYANVDSITSVPPIIKKNGFPQPFNPVSVFRLVDPDWEMFETFSKGLKAKIEASPEYRLAAKNRPNAPQAPQQPQRPTLAGGGSGFDDMDDSIPF